MTKPITSRRAAREAALRVLYTVDVGKQPIEEVLGETLTANELDAQGQAMARAIVAGTLKNQSEIDTAIDRFAVGFPINRQTAVDKNILRMAAAEILFPLTQAPPGAVVNEAVELAKKYSTADSGRFVNGVLGALVRDLTGETPPLTDVSPGETLSEEETQSEGEDA